MALTVPSAIAALISSEDYEFHSSLDITLGNTTTVHVATDSFQDLLTQDFGVVDYVADLREVGGSSESATLSVNRLDLRAQNVDGVLGRFIRSSKALNGAQGIWSIIYIDDSGVATQLPIMYGEVSNAADQDPDVVFQLISDLSTDGPIGGYRTLQNSCFNRYKIEIRCASQSPLAQACDHTKTGPNGCIAHLAALGVDTPVEGDNRSRYTGFEFQVHPLPGTPPAGPTGVVDGGDDFTSYFKARQSLGGYEGRWATPHHEPIF